MLFDRFREYEDERSYDDDEDGLLIEDDLSAYNSHALDDQDFFLLDDDDLEIVDDDDEIVDLESEDDAD